MLDWHARYCWAVYCEICRRGDPKPARDGGLLSRLGSALGIRKADADRMPGMVRGMARLPLPILKALLREAFPTAPFEWQGLDFLEAWP